MKPPIRPTKSETAVSSGSIVTVAITRGVMSLRIGSVPSARIASTCSVTTIEPSSDAMPEALRPATSSAVMVGPKLADQSERDRIAGERRFAEALELRGGLQHQHTADEKPGEHDDRQRSDADQIHLLERVGPILRRRKNIGDDRKVSSE